MRILARRHLDGAADRAVRNILAQKIHWQVFFDETLDHGVTALVHRQLRANYSSVVPAQILDRMKQLVLANTQYNLALLRELLALHAELERMQVPHIFFKGLVVAQTVYRDMSLRRCGDIDVLVPPQEFPACKAHFLQQGFVQTLTDKQERDCLQSGLWHEQRQLNVDLHYGIPPLEGRVPVAPLFQNMQRVMMAGQAIPVFGADDMIITYCFNAVKEYWSQSLYHYADLYAMIDAPSCDPKKLWRAASRLGGRSALLMVISMLHKIYDMPVTGFPAPRRGVVRAGRELELRLFAPKSADPHLHRGKLVVPMLHADYMANLIDNPWRRFRAGRGRYLLPNQADYQLINLPVKFHFLYFVLRPCRLLLKLCRQWLVGGK